MKKQILLYIYCVLLLFTNAFVEMAYATAEHCRSEHFIIHSDLDPRYVQFVQANAEAYYENLKERYFQTGLEKALIIYYSETESETQLLLGKHGYQDEAKNGCYVAGVPAVYVHRLSNEGQVIGWGALFGEITHHFIQLNFQDAPEWFNEGFACFFGEQGHIVNGKLIIGGLNSKHLEILKDRMDKGRKWNIRALFSARAEQFYNSDEGRAFTRAFFNWLYETGQLERYLRNVQDNGYELSVLERTVSKAFGRINVELSRFIEKHCYAGAYLEDGRQAGDDARKKEAFLKALELKPDYREVQMKLAKCCYRSKDYEKCREYLAQILDEPESVEYRQAAGLMGDACYKEKNYSEAIEYYNKAWEYSDYYEYKYRLPYRIANCYHYLEDPKSAKQWYKEFLDCKWEPESMKAQADYARKYIEAANKATVVKQGGCKEDTKKHSEKRP